MRRCLSYEIYLRRVSVAMLGFLHHSFAGGLLVHVVCTSCWTLGGLVPLALAWGLAGRTYGMSFLIFGNVAVKSRQANRALAAVVMIGCVLCGPGLAAPDAGQFWSCCIGLGTVAYVNWFTSFAPRPWIVKLLQDLDPRCYYTKMELRGALTDIRKEKSLFGFHPSILDLSYAKAAKPFIYVMQNTIVFEGTSVWHRCFGLPSCLQFCWRKQRGGEYFSQGSSTRSWGPLLFPQCADSRHGVLCAGFSFNGCWSKAFQEHAGTKTQWLVDKVLRQDNPCFKVLADVHGGLGTLDKKTVLTIMERGGNLAFVPGGFEDATLVKFGADRTFLKARTGFIKSHGSLLVTKFRCTQMNILNLCIVVFILVHSVLHDVASWLAMRRYALSHGYRVHPVYTFHESETHWTFTGRQNIENVFEETLLIKSGIFHIRRSPQVSSLAEQVRNSCRHRVRQPVHPIASAHAAIHLDVRGPGAPVSSDRGADSRGCLRVAFEVRPGAAGLEQGANNGARCERFLSSGPFFTSAEGSVAFWRALF